ncbi:MAG: DNA-directed RNA polymerase subunit beta', partial [Vampirovibrionales bacterium]
LLVVSNTHFETMTLPKGEAPALQVGDYVRLGGSVSPSVVSQVSGRVSQWDAEANALIIHKGRPYLISPGTMLPVEDQTVTQQGDHIATLIYERQKTGDIVQGLPKVEELLEGRRPKERAFIASYEATAEVQRDEDGVRLFLISDERGREEVQVPLGANVLVETGERVFVGQRLTDGSSDPHDILEVLGIEAVRTFLVDEVQRVYRSQGVDIADKHIEIIVRQMTRKIVVDDGGDTMLLPGEMIDHKLFDEAVRQAEAANQQLPTSHPVLLGITKASLNTESFISAASFQETTRVLTEAAVEGKKDILRGLKENVIIGRLIPAGTGFPSFKTDRDEAHEDDHYGSRSGARKPSAILEEIESMFGAPQITEETMAAFEGEDAQEALGGLSVMTREELSRDADSFGEIFAQEADTQEDDDLIG